MRACTGARVALIDACADADGLLAAEGGLAPGAHTLVSLSLDRHRSVYSQGYSHRGTHTGDSRVLRGKGKSPRRSVATT